MKHSGILKLIFLLTICPFMAIQFSSCKDGISAEEEFLNKVSGTWNASSTGVSVDGVAINGVFKDFGITIKNDATYSTVNGNSPIWPASGKVTVKTNSSSVGFEFVRSDGVVVAIQQFTETKLVLSLKYTDPNGRTSSVSGNYTFDLSRI